MISPPQIAVVVVSYNTKSLLLDCLASIIESAGQTPIEVIVVDNHSQDGSPDAVRGAYPRLHLITNPVNVGFGAACNQAIAASTSPLIWLLNSDARLTPEAFRCLSEIAHSHQRCGAVGCRLLDDNGREVVNTRYFLTPFNQALELAGIAKYLPVRRLSRTYHPRLDRQHPDCTVDWIDGACLLLRRTALGEVGLFDEQFFMYSEDEDLCWRLKQRGWSICYSTTATAFHQGGGSSQQAKQELQLAFYVSQLLLLDKHRGRLSIYIYIVMMTWTLLLKLALRWMTADRETRNEMRQRLTALRRAYASFVAKQHRQA